MNNKNSTHMSREELVKKLKENQNSVSFIILMGDRLNRKEYYNNKSLLQHTFT
jgi:hypothetical protein